MSKPPASSPKALITGGAGFIGSHLAQALCAMGARVVIVDNFASGSSANLTWASAGSSLEVVEGCVTHNKLIDRHVADCDWVFHQAAVVSVPHSIDDPAGSHHINLDASLQLLLSAKRAGVKRVVLASSAAVYGDGASEQKRESDPVAPLSPYGLQKYASERYAQLFHQLYGLPTVALRYFNVFGPRQSFNSPYSGVIARFCTEMLEGRAPTLFGDGLQSRDFAPVSCVVAANLAAATQPVEKVAGEVFNVAGGESVSLLDLVAEINRQTGQSLQPVHEPARRGDIRHSRACMDKAKAQLGLAEQECWREGLRLTLDHYRLQRG
jgi:UDP-glucose 4-epimerase